MNERRIPAAFNIAIIVIFLAALWLPGLESMFHFGPQLENTEQRRLSDLPELRMDRKSIIEFQSKFMKYFVDNFGFRNHLIRLNSIIKLKLLKVEQFPKVLVGTEDWLFLIKDDEGNNALDYYRSIKLFSDEREMADWARPLVEIKKRLDKMGIQFIVVFVPMKPRVYTEYVPRYYRPVRETTRLDQMLPYLKTEAGVEAVDIGGDVLEGKKEHRVFYKHDVHWNSYGAFSAYRGICAALAGRYPRMRPRSLDDYTVTASSFVGGDLANMLGLKDRFTEENYLFAPKKGVAYRTVPITYEVKAARFYEAFESGDPALPRALVFHDSFFNYVKPFLAEHFSRLACFQVYSRADLSLIEREKPDVVIYEIAESFLQKAPAYVTPLNF